MTSQALREFDSIYNETFNEIKRYVILKCRNIADVEDILQNIYTDAYKKLKKNVSVDKSYIFGIANHKINDYYRFRFKDKIVDYFKNEEDSGIENIRDEFNLEETVSNRYDTDKVWNYLKKKKSVISKIFYLYYHEELTLKEISEFLNITESNVKHYLYRTLKELNKYLKEEWFMNLKSMFTGKISKDKIYDNIVRKKVNYLFLVPSTLVVILSVMLVLNKNTSDVVYKYESDIIVINELSEKAKLNYVAKDIYINKNEIENLNNILAPIPKGYNLEHNYEWLTYDNKEKEANQVIFKNGEKIIDIFYSKHEFKKGRPKCIYVLTSELKSSTIHNHDVKIVKDYSDNYSYATSARFNYNDLFYDIEFVNLDVEEIVSYLRTILK